VHERHERHHALAPRSGEPAVDLGALPVVVHGVPGHRQARVAHVQRPEAPVLEHRRVLVGQADDHGVRRGGQDGGTEERRESEREGAHGGGG